MRAHLEPDVVPRIDPQELVEHRLDLGGLADLDHHRRGELPRSGEEAVVHVDLVEDLRRRPRSAPRAPSPGSGTRPSRGSRTRSYSVGRRSPAAVVFSSITLRRRASRAFSYATRFEDLGVSTGFTACHPARRHGRGAEWDGRPGRPCPGRSGVRPAGSRWRPPPAPPAVTASNSGLATFSDSSKYSFLKPPRPVDGRAALDHRDRRPGTARRTSADLVPMFWARRWQGTWYVDAAQGLREPCVQRALGVQARQVLEQVSRVPRHQLGVLATRPARDTPASACTSRSARARRSRGPPAPRRPGSGCCRG